MFDLKRFFRQAIITGKIAWERRNETAFPTKHVTRVNLIGNSRCSSIIKLDPFQVPEYH